MTMNQLSLNSYYKTLNAKPYCDIKELRKAYKIQIQKWHPDKYINDPAKIDIAEQKTIKVNQAYKHLLHQYRNFGQPVKPVEHAEKKTRPTIIIPPISTANSNRSSKANNSADKGYLPILLPIFITTLMIILYLYETEEKTEISSTNELVTAQFGTATTGAHSENIPVTSNSAHSDSSPTSELEEEVSFYTEGSSIKDVLSIQGVPNEVKNSIWYYGKSEVHFRNGKVTNWIRKPGSPLKARINVTK